MNGMQSGQLSEAINILLALVVFGYLYNLKIERLGHKGEGWQWLMVVIGVGVTQIGVGILDMFLGWNAFLLGLMAYSASGLPMIWGAVARYVEAHDRAHKAIHDDAA